tara:strand:- start:469 stop:2328 length:1860 start_codon:yes stop_codon:yes gene_type:complete
MLNNLVPMLLFNIFKTININILKMSLLEQAFNEHFINKEGHLALNVLKKFDANNEFYSDYSVFNEAINYFYFNLVRGNDEIIERSLIKFLTLIKGNEHHYSKEFMILYKIVGNTRDIEIGKGERDLAYMQIYVWYQFYPILATELLVHFFFMPYGKKPFGSWKDIKYFCNYVKNKSNNEDHFLIRYAIQLLNEQIEYDYNSLLDIPQKSSNLNSIYHIKYINRISFASKWVPRKSSKKFHWLYRKLAIDKYKFIYDTAKTLDQKKRAFKKCSMYYTKIIVALSNFLDIPEKLMTINGWDLIDFNNCSSMTINKYKSAFQNTDNIIRKICNENFKKHLRLTLHDPSKKINTGNIYPYEIVRGCINSKTVFDKMLADSQWKNYMITHNHYKNKLNKVIPIIDMSFEMEEDNKLPLFSAIGLGIACSEKNNDSFRNKIITFSSKASLIDFNDCTTFCTKIYKTISSKTKSRESNVYSAIELLANSIAENKLKNFEIRSMKIVIFSNMRFCGSNLYLKTFTENVIDIFAHNNLNEVPHIVLWNVGQHDGTPYFAYHPNITVISGHNSNPLNFLSKREKEKKDTKNESYRFTSIDGYNGVVNMLKHPRYKVLELIINSFLNNLS